jgi:hyperpolarization activated cyclic nucleotide-gated potassium channel 2
MACLFYLVSREESDFNPDAWIVVHGIINMPLAYQYITSLYWAITTMVTVGYGDITPITASEKVCVMICMLGSCVMFAYIVGSIGNLISKASEVADRMRTQMVNINGFLVHKRIPKDMRNKVRRYLEYAMEEKEKLQMDEEELMALLSIPLRDELNIFFHGSFLQKCHAFDDFPSDFLSYLTFFLFTEHFSIGDTIFEVLFGTIKCRKMNLARRCILLLREEL